MLTVFSYDIQQKYTLNGNDGSIYDNRDNDISQSIIESNGIYNSKYEL